MVITQIGRKIGSHRTCLGDMQNTAKITLRIFSEHGVVIWS